LVSKPSIACPIEIANKVRIIAYSVDYFRKDFPWVKVIRHSKNLGSAEGYDRAIEKVEADYVLLLLAALIKIEDLEV